MKEIINIASNRENASHLGNTSLLTGAEYNTLSNINCPTILPFATLPLLLREGAKVFDNEKERNLFIYSSIVALSGIMTKVKGTYKQKTCHPNMFFMVLAPAASGKSSMMYAKQLIQPIHQKIVTESNCN